MVRDYTPGKESVATNAHPTYDAKKMQVVDAIEAGVIDPTKVVITALKNSSSVAATILTTESVIYEKKDEKEADANPMAGMGMGM